MEKILILIGHTGSGKSEIAINKGISEAKKGEKVAIIDLDIVNPYFCIRDYKESLEKEHNIKVVSAEGNERNAELMTITHEAMSILQDGSYNTVIDTGGDLYGIKILRQFEEFLKDKQYELAFVINDFRPSTREYEEIKTYIDSLEEVTALKVTSLIYNGNLTYITDVNQIISGIKKAKDISNKLNIPILFSSVSEELATEEIIKMSEDILLIKRYIKNPWD